MNQASNLWQQMAGNFPQAMIGNPMGQGFAETWLKAFQQFQNMDLGNAAGQAVPAEQALPLYIRDKVAQTTAERAAAGLAR